MKAKRQASKNGRVGRANQAWEKFKQGASGAAAMCLHTGLEFQSPMVCLDLRDDGDWDKYPHMFSFYLPPGITESPASGLDIIWKGVPFNGPPPPDFARRVDKYLKVPAEGIRLTCTRGCPTFPAQVVEELAKLNGRRVAHPGKDLVFRERDPDTDAGEATDLAIFVTPRLFR